MMIYLLSAILREKGLDPTVGDLRQVHWAGVCEGAAQAAAVATPIAHIVRAAVARAMTLDAAARTSLVEVMGIEGHFSHMSMERSPIHPKDRCS